MMVETIQKIICMLPMFKAYLPLCPRPAEHNSWLFLRLGRGFGLGSLLSSRVMADSKHQRMLHRIGIGEIQVVLGVHGHSAVKCRSGRSYDHLGLPLAAVPPSMLQTQRALVSNVR